MSNERPPADASAARPVATMTSLSAPSTAATKSLLAAFTAAFLSVSGTPSPAEAATCGLGYLERYNKKGDSFCISAAKERTRILKQQQLLRQYQAQWRQELERDRQTLRERARLEKQATF